MLARNRVKRMLWLPAVLKAPSAVAYLLRATFDADDQDFVDAQVLDTVAEGVPAGTLTVTETTGALAIASNKMSAAAGVGGFANQGFVSQAITRALGRTLIVTVNNITSAVNLGPVIGFSASSVLDGGLVAQGGIYYANTAIQSRGTPAATTADAMANDTEHQIAVMLGGVDSNGLPYYVGQTKANYGRGSAIFVKGWNYSTWTLIWWGGTASTATLYAHVHNYQTNYTIDDLRIPDVDLSSVLDAGLVHYSSFDAANSTSLDAITPERGTGWTEQSGDWDIQSNRANPDGAAIGTIDAGAADVLIRCTVNGSTGDNPAVVLRFSDTSNYWYVQADRANNLIELHEVNATVDTVRASAAVTINDSTDYTLGVIASGSTIDAFLDNGNRITYGSATLNQTAQVHGIRSEHTSGRFDNFIVYTRTHATYDTVLNGV